MMPHAVLCLAVGLLLVADSPKEDAAKKELEKLQGTWRLVSFEVSGQVTPAENLDGRFVIKGDKYTFKSDGQEEEGTIKIDPAKDPATIDLKILTGQDKDKSQVGIYKVEGDRLTFCFALPGAKDRPAKFAAGEGTEFLLFGLKRDK